MSLNGVTATAGPNSSSHEIRISGFTSATIVGSYKAPCRRPPVTRRAPLATASLTHSSTRIASFSRIIGPTWTAGSSWLPTFSAATFGRRASRKAPYTFPAVSTRWVEMHTCPALAYPVAATAAATLSSSASGITTTGECGPHLVADEVEREVERADRHDDPARDPDRHAELAAAVRGPIEGDRLAVHALGLLGRLHHRVHGAQGLGASLREDLPFLLRDQRAELLHARGHLLGRGVEDLPARAHPASPRPHPAAISR